jgi:hypothetical protein
VNRTVSRGLLFVWALAAMPGLGEAAVQFQNTGTTSGWSKVYTQQIGRVYQATSPVYKGSTALAFEQTWNNVQTGYHSESIRANAQSNNSDRYYGKALRIPSNWPFHDDNVTFQQWSPENPEGPWMLHFIQGNRFRIQARPSGGVVDAGAVSAGVWQRIVVRLNLRTSGGAQQVWVNGTQTLNRTNVSNIVVPGTTLRWSNGIYCTGWRDSVPPSNVRKLTIYQDHFRIASSMAEADPANWNEGGGTPTPTPTPGPTPAPGDVRLFQGCNYGGWSASFGPGDYTIADIQARGGINDDASSVRVPGGYTVTLYQGNNFTGASMVLTGDDTCLTNDSFNDTVSSLRVRN